MKKVMSQRAEDAAASSYLVESGLASRRSPVAALLDDGKCQKVWIIWQH